MLYTKTSLEILTWTVDGVNDSFELPYIPDYESGIFPFINTSLVGFTLTGTSTVVLSEVPLIGDVVTIRWTTGTSAPVPAIPSTGMVLSEIRIKARDLSGRYDLVNDDESDNGMDFFINEACRWLDRSVEHTKSWATYRKFLSIGEWYVEFPDARAIKEVWLATDEGKWQLKVMRLQDLIASFYGELPADWESGAPEYYSPGITRDANAVPAGSTTYVGVITSTGSHYNAVILSCPVDRTTLVEVVGLYKSEELVEDDDQNYWTIVDPMLLIQAVMRRLCIVSGNAALLSTLTKGIADDITKLDYELVDQMLSEADEMDG